MIQVGKHKYPEPPEHWKHLRFFKHKYRELCEELGDPGQYVPRKENWFRPLELVKPDDVKVVIIGGRPYVNGQATGLAFDCSSLKHTHSTTIRSIHIEYCRDLGFREPKLPTLLPWTEKGVLLLNAAITAEKDSRLTFDNETGWELLTFEIMSELSYTRKGIVWMLWSAEVSYLDAALWNRNDHLSIVTSHPARSFDNTNLKHVEDFAGSSCFTRACDYMGVTKDFWRLM